MFGLIFIVFRSMSPDSAATPPRINFIDDNPSRMDEVSVFLSPPPPPPPLPASAITGTQISIVNKAMQKTDR